MSKKNGPVKFNYLYFGIFFILLILISTSSVFAKESLSESKIFFLLYAAGQSLLEVALLIFCGWMIQRFSGRIGFSTFVGATFVFLILHLLDFVMERILDLSIWETLGFVLDENLENFLYLLDASGISLWIWGIIFLLLAALPFLGMALYHLVEKLTRRTPLFLKKEYFFQAFICLPVALLFWEYSAAPIIHPNSYTGFIKSLPWKFTFLQPKNVFLTLQEPLKQPVGEDKLLEVIELDTTQIEAKPNIYLFVIESFREDFITPEIAPSLTQFKNEAHHFDLALSNGNGSHLSWFSIFHSQFPYFWHQVQKKGWSMGSAPIHLLKKWGYQVRLYSSAQLNYYGMEDLLFGEDHHLVDSFQTFHHIPPLAACDSDAIALSKLQEDLKDPKLQQGQLIIIFWDSTHFDYSWPKLGADQFSPVAKDFAYFRLFHSEQNIEQIKNRYKNAVFYIDSLFDKFIKNVPKKEEALVIITGDHGEEFFEQGNLFHGSHIAHQQTNIPLYMKFGNERAEVDHKMVSQMDIFPSILHYLAKKPVRFFEGQSIFEENKWPFAVIARFNAGRTPYEFCIHNGKNKFIAQFTDKKNVFSSKQLKIQSLCNYKDAQLCRPQSDMNGWIQAEFGEALDRMFEKNPNS